MDLENKGILEAEENEEIEYVFEEPQPKIDNTTGEAYLNALGLNEEQKSERKIENEGSDADVLEGSTTRRLLSLEDLLAKIASQCERIERESELRARESKEIATLLAAKCNTDYTITRRKLRPSQPLCKHTRADLTVLKSRLHRTRSSLGISTIA